MKRKMLPHLENNPQPRGARTLSLAPLSFQEAVAGLLKGKPEPKAPKKKPSAKKRASKAK